MKWIVQVPRLRVIAGRYTRMLGYIGYVAVISGVVVASPAIVVLAFPSELSTQPAYLIPGALLVLLGTLARRLGPDDGGALNWAEGAVVVLVSWVLAVLFAAVPFMWVGGLDFTQAVFESTSGWTTTGLSVVDVASAHPTILFLRSALQLAGGAGLAILMLSALVGPSGTGIASAEGKEERLVPVVGRSSALVVRIYTGYAFIGTLALRVAGMTWFDAVNHSFTAVSTGGFSTRVDSIGSWDSPAIEATLTVLMVAGNLSFVTAWAAARGKWREVLSNGEVRTFALFAAVGVLLVWAGVTDGHFPHPNKAVRVAVFETMSALTTTGFSTVGYLPWPSVGWCILILLMVVGGGTCSTAGGLKQYRVYVVYRYLSHDVIRRLRPSRAVSAPYVHDGASRRFLTDAEIAGVGGFMLLYFAALGVGTTILAAYGYGLRESLFEFASALGTVGLSVGVTAPTAPAGLLWTETAGMLFGRLEFFTVLVGSARVVQDARFTGIAVWHALKTPRGHG